MLQGFSLIVMSWGLLFLMAHGLLIAVTFLVVEHRLQAHRLQWLCMWIH